MKEEVFRGRNLIEKIVTDIRNNVLWYRYRYYAETNN
jgi:hypothetical protein